VLLNARPGYLSDGACDHLLRRMLSHLSESLPVPRSSMPTDLLHMTRGGHARSGECSAWEAARAQHA
jgi:hypothetical protein